MSLELQTKQIVDRWVGAARPNREGRPTWQVGLDYMAVATHYHATAINGFEGTIKDWLRHLIEHVPAEPYPHLQQELTQQLHSGTLNLATTPTPAPQESAEPADTSPKAEANSDNEDDLDDWLDEL